MERIEKNNRDMDAKELNYAEQMKLCPNEIKFIEDTYGISEIDFKAFLEFAEACRQSKYAEPSNISEMIKEIGEEIRIFEDLLWIKFHGC